MTGSADFWDKVADRYAKSPVRDEASYRRKLAESQACFRADMALLEFGCGTGSTALAHAPHVAHVLATDVSARMLEIAREKAAAAGVSNVTFEQADIEGFDAPDESFDAVLTLSLLHLLNDRPAALAQIRRLLKPGGLFISNTVCLSEMNPLIRLILPLMRLAGIAPPVRSLSGAQLMEEIEAAGFRVEFDWRPARNKALFVIARRPG